MSETMRKQLQQYALERYGDVPSYPFANYPEIAVLRHGVDGKWYALFTDVPAEKFGLEVTKPDEMVSVVNLKCNPDDSPALCMQADIFPAWHMNKKHWISVLLDRSAPLPLVEELLACSYELTK